MVVYQGRRTWKMYHAACGRGGSWTGQNGLVVIELLPLAVALDAAVSSPSASPSGEPMRISSAPPTSMPTTSATARTANHQSMASLFLLILLPMALCAALCTCCILRFGCYYFTGQTNSDTAIAILSRLQLVSTSPSSSANTCGLSNRDTGRPVGIHDGGDAAGRGRRWGPEWLHGGFYRHRPCITARIGIVNSSLTCFPIAASTYVCIYPYTP